MKKITSAINGELEITTYRGRKILDGKSVNLSYGSVHKIWKDALGHISLPEMKNILLLGLGGGSVVSLLKNDFAYKGNITAIELDPVMIQIAGSEFGIRNSRKLNIHCADAFSWIKESDESFDLVLVDVFIEAKLAPQMLKQAFWNDLHRVLTMNGTSIVNFSVKGRLPAGAETVLEKARSKFDLRVIRKAGGSNTLVVAVKKDKRS